MPIFVPFAVLLWAAAASSSCFHINGLLIVSELCLFRTRSEAVMRDRGKKELFLLLAQQIVWWMQVDSLLNIAVWLQRHLE